MKSSQIPPETHNDKVAFDNAVESNMGLVYSIAKMFSGKGCEYEDLIQIGCVGLIKAVKRFDKNFGVQFSTYAVPVISGEIRRFLRDDGMIKISRSVKENAGKGNKAREELRKETGSEPTINEISKRCAVPPEELLYAFEACNPCMSTDSEAYKPDGVSYEDETVDKIFISQALSALPSRERQVIILRYMSGKTQAAIAALLGISQVQVSRIEKKALEMIKSAIT